MFTVNDEIYCGLYDSSILRKEQTHSDNRVVQVYELEVFHSDGGVSYINGKVYPIRRGMLLCVKPNSVRRSDFPVRCNFIHLSATSESNRDVYSILDKLPDCVYLDDDDRLEELIEAFNKLGMFFISPSSMQSSLLRINSVFLDIIYRCVKLFEDHPFKSNTNHVNRIVRETYEYINAHYRTDCSLEVLASAVNASPNHLRTVFEQNVGMTPAEYVRQKRVKKAQKLIMVGELSLLEIALETGFCSQSHFAKVFKEQTGKTPTLYRKELLEKY